MNLTVVVAPPYEPISLAEVWQFLRLDPQLVGSPGALEHQDDAMLRRMISSSRIQCEQITRRSFVQQTLRLSSGFPMTLDAIPVPDSDVVLLFCPPIIEVLSVGYRDSSNSLVTMSAGAFYVTDDQVPQLRFTASAPTTFNRQDAFSVEYVAGYPPDGSPPTTQADFAANVPSHFKDAILLGVQLLYDELLPANRAAIENARMALLSADIVYTV